MGPWGNGLLSRATGLRGGEATVAVLMFAYSFLAMTSYNILKPLTRSKFIADLGADNLPYVLLASGLLIGVLMHLYTRAVSPLPRRHVISVTQGALVVVLVAFWPLLRSGAAWVAVAFYVLGQILGVFLISQFWTLANDIYDARQAKRLFGFIGGGASLGGAMGAGLTATLVRQVGADNLVLVGAAALACCLVVVTAIVRRHPPEDTASLLEERGVGAREALQLLAESRHLKVMVLVIGFAAAGAAIIDQQLNMAAEASKGAGQTDAITAFLATVSFWTSVAGFVVQVALTSRIHRSLGLVFALLLLPVGFGMSATVILLTGAFWAPAVARVLDSTFRYTVDKTTREVLFLPLPPELKFRAKPFIDVTADRFAKAAAALLLLVLIKGFGFDWRSLSYASLTMIAAWVATALVARREYLRTFRASIGTRAIGPDAVRTEVDAATVEALVEELSNPDEAAVLYAIDMLEAMGKRNLVTPLLLHHDSPRVRARALRALASGQSRTARRWLATIDRMVHDEDVDVRAAALRAIAELSHQDAAELMRRHLTDVQPRVAVTAAVALANSGRPADVDAAEHALKALIADSRDAAAAGRREAAAALAHIRPPRFRPLLVPLIHDADAAVAHEAVHSARLMGAEDGLFVPALMALLAHRPLKVAARDALVSYGDTVIDALAHALRDPREQVWVRRHIPATLARIGGPHALEALVASLDDPDGFLRYKTIVAIESLVRADPTLAGPGAVIETLVVKESLRYYATLTLRANLLDRAEGAGQTLLARALDDKLHRAVDRIYRLLGLLHGVHDVATARHVIEHGDARRRGAALEYLDNLLGGVVRKRVLPILDDSALAERVALGYSLLRSRPRDLEDTLAQLIHDDDPVIAASAIHFVAQRRLWSLADDLDYVASRRPREDRVVLEAVAWAAATRAAGQPVMSLAESLPVVEFADRVRGLRLFEPASVDELFRIAGVAQEVRHHPGRDIWCAGDRADGVLILLEGSVRADATPATEIAAPAVLGFKEVLQGRPAAVTLRAVEHCICFRIPAADFITMVSEDVVLAQGLFHMLLQGRGATAFAPRGAIASERDRPAREHSVDQALLLRHDPLLARASGSQLMALTASGRDIAFDRGTVLFDSGTPPAIYVVLRGELMLEGDAAGPVAVPAGSTLGVAESLAGITPACRGVGAAPGTALRIDRDALFTVLEDDTALMQELFSGVLALSRAQPADLP